MYFTHITPILKVKKPAKKKRFQVGWEGAVGLIGSRPEKKSKEN